MDSDILSSAMKAASSAVDRVLDKIIQNGSGAETQLVEAMRYAVLSPGKRLRPFLTICAAEVFDVARPVAVRTGAALECIHSYSLVHDDLPAMDDDDLRRGRPTLHKAYDEATAILAGDALLTLAFEIVSAPETSPKAEVRAELCRTLAKAAGYQGMVGGQMIDLSAAREPLAESAIHRMQQMKTGALICASVEAGAVLGEASTKARQSLNYYARDLGVAFQIADDLLDVEGTEEATGKAVRKDADHGKSTFVELLGVERARQQATMLADQAIEHLADFGDKATLLRAVAHFAVNRSH